MNREKIKLYKKNIRYLREYRKNIYKKLTQRVEESYFPIELIENEYGLNLYMDGKVLFNSQYEYNLKEKVNVFTEIIKRRVLEVNLSLENAGIWEDSIHVQSLRDIINLIKKYQSEESAENRYIPFLLIYGVGLGKHIEYLLREFEIKNLVLIDQDIELLRPLLYLYDLEELLEDTEFYVAYGKNPQNVASQVLEFFHQKPIYVDFYDEYILYETSLFDQISKHIADNMIEVKHTFGFFDDEIMSIEHTLKNISKQPPFYYKKKNITDKIPVFIIGSGPSLDKDLPIIKKYSESAVIFSCGTALKPLLDYGIEPDFEFILERTKAPYDVFIQSADFEQLQKIKKILSNHIYPDFFEKFNNCFMLARNSDVGSTLLDLNAHNALNYTTPTVTNFALSFAIHQGFRDIYLFGVDLGYKDAAKHHSSKSIYYHSKDFKVKKMDQSYELDGNFGGKFYANATLYTTKISIENILKFHKGKLFNCSDGAKIEGAFSLKAEQIDIDIAGSKSFVLAEIESNFDRSYFENFDSIKAKLDQVNNEFENFSQHLSEPPNRLDELYTYFEELQECIKATQKNESFFSLVKGTLYSNLSYALLFSHTIASEEKKVEFLQEVLHSFKELVLSMRKRFEQTKKYLP